MRPLSCYLVQVEIDRNRGVVVDIARCARQAVEIGENESTDAVQFEGSSSIPSSSVRNSFQGAASGRACLSAGILKVFRPHVGQQVPVCGVLCAILPQPFPLTLCTRWTVKRIFFGQPAVIE